MNGEIEQKNSRLVKKLLLVVFLMFGFGYALVPLYNVVCDKILGIKTGTEAVAEQVYEVDVERTLTIEFVTSLNKEAPITFRPEMKKMKIHPGKYYTVSFYAENKTDKKMIAMAVNSVTPGPVAGYLKKTECFCFSEQIFEPNEVKLMPVRFVIDPDLPKEYKTITLAYTFFDNTEKSVKK